MAGATVEANGSDNGLLTGSWIRRSAARRSPPPTPPTRTGRAGRRRLNELSARQNQKGTIALLPVNDPQLLVGGQFSIGKTNTYRIETDQPPLPFRTNTCAERGGVLPEHGQRPDRPG